MITLQKLQTFSCFKDTTLLAFFLFWSQIQWTANEKSDYDINVIVETLDINKIDSQFYTIVDWKNYNFTVYTLKDYIERLNRCDTSVLESYFSPIQETIVEIPFVLNLQKLRTWISSTVDNSWVKAKKKIILPDEDDFIWYKSLYHSFRLLDIWIQLATTEIITKWDTQKDLLQELLQEKLSWDELDLKYRLKWNELKSAFKKVAPKV